MVKKLGEGDKPIEAKKQIRRRYVRKLNPVLPKLNVSDFLPKLKGKTGKNLQREVMQIRETLESEYNELKKRVSERKQKALEELSVKSTETLKKEEIKKEKADAIELEKQNKVILKKADESNKVAIAAVLDYLDTKKTPTQILAEVPSFSKASKTTKANFMRRLKEEVKTNKGNADDYVRAVRSSDAEDQKILVESVEPLPAVKVLKMTAAERASDGSKKITEYMKPVVVMPSLAPPLAPEGSDSEAELGGAGFSKLKKHVKEHNIALIGKEEQMRMGEMSISVARDIRQLNELKRNHRGVVIRRSDIIDAERPINYELSIM